MTCGIGTHAGAVTIVECLLSVHSAMQPFLPFATTISRFVHQTKSGILVSKPLHFLVFFLSIRNLATMLFLVMAVIQFNDPDPAYWITTYTLTGICAHGPRLGLLLLPVVWTTAGLVLAGLLLSLPGFIQFVSLGQWSSLAGTMSTSQPQIEFAREFLGLLFCVVCLVVVIRQNGLLATTTQLH